MDIKTIEEAKKYKYGYPYECQYVGGYCIVEVAERHGWPPYHQCNRKIWKDGFCKQHHPDTVAERRKSKKKSGKKNINPHRLDSSKG